MKKSNKANRLRKFVNTLLIAALITQSIALLVTKNTALASTEPHGPLRRVVVTYRGVAATHPDADKLQKQALDLQQRQTWLASSLQQMSGYKKITMT